MNEEYTYNIGKYTIGVDTNGEDGIGLTVAIISDDGEIHLLGNCYGDNARCIDFLIKENQQLKEKLEISEKARKEAIDYINFLVIIDTQLAGGRFKDTIWGKELLEILDTDKGE